MNRIFQFLILLPIFLLLIFFISSITAKQALAWADCSQPGTEGAVCDQWYDPNYCCGGIVCNDEIKVYCNGGWCDTTYTQKTNTVYHDPCALGASCNPDCKTCNYVSEYNQCTCSTGISQHVINKQWSDGSGWCGSVGACDQVDHSCGDTCNLVSEYNACCSAGLSQHVIDKRWASNNEQCGSVGACDQADRTCDTCNLVNEYNVCCGDGLSKHVIDKRWASDSAQCGSVGACNQADASCAAGTPKYKCSGASCIRDDAGGTFTTSNCNNTCGAVVAKYKCNGASCIRDDAGGTFTTSNCNNTCSGIDPTYDTNLYIDPSNPVTGTATTFTATGTVSCSAYIDLTVGNGMYSCSQTGGYTCSGGNPKDGHPCWWRWSCTARNPATYTATFYGNNDKITGNTECVSSASYTVMPNPGTINGKVWDDSITPNDGTLDSGEVGLSGMTVYVDDLSHYATTNANGDFSYTLSPGTHTVYMTQADLDSGGWIISTSTALSRSVTITAGNSTWVSFGLIKAGKIYGYVWENAQTSNNLSVFEAGERGLNGIKIYADGTEKATTATNIVSGLAGYYLTPNIPIGTRVVSISNLTDPVFLVYGNNWFFNTPLSGSRSVTVTQGGTVQASFGLQRSIPAWLKVTGGDVHSNK